MMKIVLATHNHNKLREFREIFSSALSGETKEPLEIISLTDIGFFDEIEETCTTFEENALIKARAAASLGYITISDDSGLEVDALSGAPGVFSARYAGEECDDEKNNEKLLSALEGLPLKKRSARFVCAIACVFPDSDKAFTVRGAVEGFIGFEKHGSGGFGYDPLFISADFDDGRTFGELSPEDKNKISHRRRAIEKFADEFKKYLDIQV